MRGWKMATKATSYRDGRVRRFHAGLAGALLAGACLAAAPGVTAQQSASGQQEPPSLGAIARQLRAEKQPGPTAKKVWTNENLPSNPFAISVIGPPAPPPVETAAPAEAAKPEAAPGADIDKGKSLVQMEAELEKTKQDLALKEKELDLAKRDYVLQQQAFYTNPMASQDTAGQAQLAQVQEQIDAKAIEVDKMKARVADLQAKVDSMKGPAPATEGASASQPQGN